MTIYNHLLCYYTMFIGSEDIQGGNITFPFPRQTNESSQNGDCLDRGTIGLDTQPFLESLI